MAYRWVLRAPDDTFYVNPGVFGPREDARLFQSEKEAHQKAMGDYLMVEMVKVVIKDGE